MLLHLVSRKLVWFTIAVVPHIAPAHADLESPCQGILVRENYPENRRFLFPLTVHAETGWIFQPSDLVSDFNLKEVDYILLRKLRENIIDLGSNLAILLPPPRPIIASTTDPTVNAILPHDFQDGGASREFSNIIENLNSIGIIAPDILKELEKDPSIIDLFYLKQDNHWSPIGARFSAAALGRDIRNHGITLPPSGKDYVFDAGREFRSVGAFGQVINEICGPYVEPEISVYEGIVESTGGGEAFAEALFSEGASDRTVSLVGTSFSNGDGSDIFRWQDAVEYELGAKSRNLAVGGGGLDVSIINAFSESTFIENSSLIVWESPPSHFSFEWEPTLRELLGLSVGDCEGPFARKSTHTFSGPDASVVLTEFSSLQDIWRLEFLGQDLPAQLHFQLVSHDGTTENLIIRRSPRFMSEIRSMSTAFYLADPKLPYPLGNPQSVSLRLPTIKSPIEVHVTACASELP